MASRTNFWTEAQLQTALKTTLLTMAGITTKQVLVNDWDPLDGSFAGGPWYVIRTSENFIEQGVELTYYMVVEIWVGFTNHSASMAAFLDARQKLLDLFHNDVEGAGSLGLDAVVVSEIENTTGIDSVYKYEGQPHAFPLFFEQDITLKVDLFSKG